MSFVEAIQSCLSQYATFRGRARRSEYWYFVLAVVLASIAALIVDLTAFGRPILEPIVSLGAMIPSIAVASRRLHDTDRTGWWQLLGFVPLIGPILLIIWLASEGTRGENRYGHEI